MVKQVLIIVLIACFATSCKTASIIQESQTKTTQQVALGSIGFDKDYILQTGFNSAAIPTYKNPIKLSALVKPFTKQKHKTFIKAKALQSAIVNINYIDTLDVKPKFIQFKIADKVTLIEALNNTTNYGVKDYLSHNKAAHIISGISMAFSKQELNTIQQADAIFLVENGMKHYALQLYKSGKKTETIPFSKGVVFAYTTAHCCWQESKRKQLNIVDLVSTYNNCPNKTYRTSKRAIKEDKLF